MAIHTEYVGDATITYGIDESQHDMEMPHRVAVALGLQLPGSGRLHTDTVWVAPIQGDTDADLLAKGYSTFLSFLSAAAEAYYGDMHGVATENLDLFPTDVTEWAYQNSDAIEMAGLDMENAE